jgi:hypothetical protein
MIYLIAGKAMISGLPMNYRCALGSKKEPSFELRDASHQLTNTPHQQIFQNRTRISEHTICAANQFHFQLQRGLGTRPR